MTISTGKATNYRKLRDLIIGNGGTVPPPPPPVDPPPPSSDNYGPIIEEWIDKVVSKDSGKEFECPKQWPEVLSLAPKSPGGRHMKWEGLTNKLVDFGGRTLVASESSLFLRLDKMDGLTIQNATIIGHGDVATLGVWNKSKRAFVINEAMPTGVNIYTVGTIPVPYTSGPLRQDQIYQEVFVQDQTAHRGSPDKYGTYKLVGREWVWMSGEVPPFEDGQPVTIQLENNNGHCIVPNCEDYIKNLTFKNILFVNIPGMIISGESDGNIVIDSCRSLPKIGGLLASASDGFHFDNSKPGFVIKNCNLGRCNDDFVNLNAKWAYVELVDKATKTVTVTAVPEMSGAINIGKFCDSGEEMVFCERDSTGRPKDNNVAFIQKSSSRSKESAKRHTFTLESVTGIEVGMLIVNRDRTTNNGIITGNTFNGTRASGIKARGSNISITNNKILNCYGTAIRVDNHTDRGEGVFPRNITASNNVVIGSGIRNDGEFPKKPGDSPKPYYIDPNCELVTIS